MQRQPWDTQLMRRASLSVLALHLAACAAKKKNHGPPVEWAPDPIAIATWTNKGFGDEEDESDANILEPEDFLWQKLEVSARTADSCTRMHPPSSRYYVLRRTQGRCCFTGSWTEEKNPTFKSHGTCQECTLWGDPDASCHRDETSCAECGSQLYCDGKPPPLTEAGRVCTGSSRVGAGCEDALAMGVCMTYSIQDCIKACQV